MMDARGSFPVDPAASAYWFAPGPIATGNGLEPANFRTFAAQAAPVHVHFGHRCVHGFNTRHVRPDEQVGVRFFHVTVQKLNVGLQGNSQVGGHGRLPRSPFPAGYTDDH